MAPSTFQPKRLLLAGMLAGAAVSVLPAVATFGKNRRSPILPRPVPLLVPVPAPPPVIVPEPPTDALFYDIPPHSVDHEWLAQVSCDSAAAADGTSDNLPVDFSGHVTWQHGRFPEELPTPTFLTIELQDASGDEKVEDRPLLYVHREEISEVYEEGESVQFAFCAKVPDVEQYGLYARVMPAAPAESNMNDDGAVSPQPSFAGLTDIEAGLKAYNDVRVRLFKATPRDPEKYAYTDKDDMAADDPTDSAGETAADIPPAGEGGTSDTSPSDATKTAPTVSSPGVEVCNFSDMQPDVRGVAARVILDVPPSLASSTTLPEPTVLTVLLEEVNPEEDFDAMSNEPLAVFSSDITQWYSAGEKLTAMLCAQIPAQSSNAAMSYKLRSFLNVGWDGYDETKGSDAGSDPEAEDDPFQKLRSGDYMAEATVVVVPNEDSYVVKAPLVPYDS